MSVREGSMWPDSPKFKAERDGRLTAVKGEMLWETVSQRHSCMIDPGQDFNERTHASEC